MISNVALKESVGAAYEGLGIDITDVNATFVMEENLVAIATRTDGQVVLIRGLVGHERLDNKVLEHSLDTFHIDLVVQGEKRVS
jgi:hypothetical protein